MSTSNNRPFLLAILLSGISLADPFGCGGKEFVLGAVFIDSGTSPTPNLVRLERLRGIPEPTVAFAVLLGGPTASADLHSFSFDLVLSDPSVVRYAGSATLGTALSIGAGQGSNVQVTQTDNRIVVWVTKTGGGAGNAVGEGEASIVDLFFEVLKVGDTTIGFEGSPSNPGYPTVEPAALDSSGAVTDSVSFDAAAAGLSGIDRVID